MKNKKLFWLIAFTLLMPLFALTGCSDDDEQETKLTQITLNNDSMLLTHGESYALSVNEAVEVEWSSLDPFVATVNENGVVTGLHVGATFIEAKTVDGLSTACTIIVAPLYYTYQEPYIEWGKTQAEVLEGQDLAQDYTLDGTEVSYSQGTGKTYSALYKIDPYKGLYYAELQINGSYEDEIHKFLEERYTYVGLEDGVRYYIHGLSTETYDYSVRCYRVKHYSKTYIAIAYLSGEYVRAIQSN